MARIVRLEASNIKRLRAVDVTPNGAGVTIVGGRNAQGKSSLLDSIAYAFAGGRSLPEAPIRAGEESAYVVAETEDFIVRRTFTASGSRVEITNREGMKYQSPQSILDALIGPIAFDPLSFIRASPKEQQTMLRDVLGVDTSDLERERAELYEERREINREAKSYAAQRDAIDLGEGLIPDAEIPMKDLLDEVAAAEAHNSTINNLAALSDRYAEKHRKAVAAREEAEAAVVRAKEVEEACLQAAADAVIAVAEADPPIDVDAIRARADEIDAHNDRWRLWKRKEELAQKTIRLESQSNLATERIAEIDGERAGMIAGANVPIPGLSLSADGVTFKDVPIAQASMSEQIRVSCAIAFAGDPRLKVAFVRDGSLLDDAALAELAALAADRDFQVWVERVGDDDPGAIIIEDGEVRATEAAS